MRHTVLAAIIVATCGCSDPETSKNNNPESDAGTDATQPNNTSNNATNNGSNNATSNNPNNGGTDMGTADTGPPSPCPASLPDADAACSDEGLRCEYGDDPRERCRDIATCDDGNWALDEPACEPLPDAMCPMTRDDASGMDCDTMNAFCAYGDLVCECTNCTRGGPVEMCAGDPTWVCDVPNADPGCPEGKPRLGTRCAEDGKQCQYACGPDGGRVCRGGAWNRSDGGMCPVSTATVKRDIRYLSAPELAEISSALQKIPLARYEYTDASIGRGEKLGFIIEDLPAESPAVDQQRLMVDLYGYTSMLVADAQAREKRMRELEARLDQLESRAAACVE